MKSSSRLAKEVIRATWISRSKVDAWDFCLYCDYDFFSKRPFLKLIAYCFQWIIQKGNTPKHIVKYAKIQLKKNGYYYSGGQPHKIAVSLPPRSGKSYIASVCSAWAIGKYPTESIMRNACTERLYQKFSYDIRDILRNDKFKSVFDVELSKDKQAISGWNTTKSKQVTYFGAGVGGTIIGFGASRIAITDDLYKSMIDALSPNTIEKVKLWKDSAHDTRLEKNCPEMDIGTRWSKKDIIGLSEAENEYDIIIRVAAIKNERSFCSDVKTTKEYKKIRAKFIREGEEFMWDSMFQQAPIEMKGSAFPKSKLNRFKLKDIERFENIVKINYTDVADQGNDYLCSGYAGIIGSKVYLLDVIYTKHDSDYTIPKSIEMLEKHVPDKSIYESNNQGLMYTKLLIKTLQDDDLGDKHHIDATPNTTNKHSRIVVQAGWVVKNMYFLDESELRDLPEYKLYLDHLCDYMKNKPSEPDDAPDMTAGLAKFARNTIM